MIMNLLKQENIIYSKKLGTGLFFPSASRQPASSGKWLIRIRALASLGGIGRLCFRRLKLANTQEET
jgi:hypothetical protein